MQLIDLTLALAFKENHSTPKGAGQLRFLNPGRVRTAASQQQHRETQCCCSQDHVAADGGPEWHFPSVVLAEERKRELTVDGGTQGGLVSPFAVLSKHVCRWERGGERDRKSDYHRH